MSKTHVIDGVTYVEVDRKAKVGEKVIVLKFTELGDVGSVYEVKAAYDFGVFVIGRSHSIDYRNYRILEPLESEEVTVDSTQASEQVIEMFAALSRKIVSLESQLRDTQRNVERQAEELADVKYNAKKHIERITCDVITLDARTQVINAITKFYEEGSR